MQGERPSLTVVPGGHSEHVCEMPPPFGRDAENPVGHKGAANTLPFCIMSAHEKAMKVGFARLLAALVGIVPCDAETCAPQKAAFEPSARIGVKSATCNEKAVDAVSPRV